MRASPGLIFALLLVLAFSASTTLQPRAVNWTANRGSDNLLQVLLGDGRQLLANHLFVKADVYFHSGYYPSVFDQQHAPADSQHMEGHDLDTHAEEEHEKAMSFLHQPHDWIERFGRHFMITSHSHLSGGGSREVLPWLRLAADLDPQRVETYTVAAYWLRDQLHNSSQAEQFLREGLHANPGNPDILFELGRLCSEDFHDPARAYNLWELAYKYWIQRESKKEKPNFLLLNEITVRLGLLDRDQGRYPKAIEWLGIAKTASPDPTAIQALIDAIQAKLPATPLR